MSETETRTKDLVKINLAIEARLWKKEQEIKELREELKDNLGQLADVVKPSEKVLIRVGRKFFLIENGFNTYSKGSGINIEKMNLSE